MRLSRPKNLKFDWITVILYLLLVGFGWLNIFSASLSGEVSSYFDLSQPYGKQLVFMLCSILLIVLIFSIEAKFYERFASIIYLVSILSLLGLFLFGKTVNGATSWYAFGGMTLQPSEFAKVATALAVAKYISDLQTNINYIKHQLRTVLIIAIPAILVLLQNDTGSTIVYAAFFFVFYREGVPKIYLFVSLSLILLSVAALKFGAVITTVVALLIIFTYHLPGKRSLDSCSLFSLHCSAWP